MLRHQSPCLIAGTSVTRTDINCLSGSPIVDFLWREQGATFQFAGTIAGLLTEQDLEHLVAPMVGQ